ncbi:hypothetical protein M2272_005464 [Mycobacterium frederiksbergense]|uniref:DUF2029 domain-containing protein n=1 Tax=Mycolicibacterium frederiksbergense TaxID=117567 RepID=A0ABT6L7A1_9MYCO|nr:hypothetical protein [Mycolicibacterium frederiksbergense]MDH6198804.1 hypothetical protein [Mycolicibacterium frederiksbergense]
MTSSPPNVLLVAGIAIGIAGVSTAMFVKNISVERRIYWISWLLATPLISLSIHDRGWRSVAVVAAMCLTMSWLYAYLRTPYIKFGDRVHAYTLFNSRPDPPTDGSPHPPIDHPVDAYGNWLTAPKFWWTIAIFSAVAGLLAAEQSRMPVTIGGAAFIVAILAFVGYIDSHENFPVARRQYVQLAVVVIASIPLLMLPPIAYALGYYSLNPRPRRR